MIKQQNSSLSEGIPNKEPFKPFFLFQKSFYVILTVCICIFLCTLDFDIDIDLQLDAESDTPQTQLDTDEDVDDMNCTRKLWTTSEPGTVELFANVIEESEASTSQSESVGNKDESFPAMSPNYTDKDDMKELTEEEHREMFNEEFLPQTSPPGFCESQSLGDTSSESDEELREKSSQCESVDNKDEAFLAMSPNYTDKDDMKEFTEDDQEQIEESLADYPSDISHSETEESTENAPSQTFPLMDVSSGEDRPTHRMEDLSNAENMILKNKDTPTLDPNFETKDLEVDMISASADIDVSFQRGSVDEADAQKSLTNDRNTEEDTTNREDSGDELDGNDQADYISDSSSEDHSMSQEEDHSMSQQEETNILSSARKEEEMNHVTQHNCSVEDMTRLDDDIDYICVDTGDEDAYSPEKQDVGHLFSTDVEERGFINTSLSSYYEEPNTENTELHHSPESVQSDSCIKDHDKLFPESSDDVEDTKNLITEVLGASGLMMDEDNLCLDEYDWDLSGEDLFKISSGEGENQDYTDEALDDLDFGSCDRDWDMEKSRIEAFYRFYGDQAEAEDDVGKCFTKHTSVLFNCLFIIIKM